jgi:glycine hydroxymethyltransferase
MGLDLSAGGHLTRLAGQHVRQVVQGRAYSVRRDDQLLDMEAVRKARQGTSKADLAGGTAIRAAWDFKKFREIADSVGAYLMVDMAHIAGLVAGGVSVAFPHAHVVTTTTHKSLPVARRHHQQRRGDRQKMNSAVFPACRADR